MLAPRWRWTSTSPQPTWKLRCALVAGWVGIRSTTATLLNLPNNWGWLAKWGALADLLGRESETTDRQRADYCLKRYQQGLEDLKEANWLLLATIDNLPVDTPSVKDLDGSRQNGKTIRLHGLLSSTAGMDLIAACPPINAAPVIQFIGSATVKHRLGIYRTRSHCRIKAEWEPPWFSS